jgi:hypothetical protein
MKMFRGTNKILENVCTRDFAGHVGIFLYISGFFAHFIIGRSFIWR